MLRCISLVPPAIVKGDGVEVRMRRLATQRRSLINESAPCTDGRERRARNALHEFGRVELGDRGFGVRKLACCLHADDAICQQSVDLYFD
jgi:hypothetical protein